MLIIDRFEGDFAIIETDEDTFMQIPRKELPQNAREGDIIVKANDEYIIDHESTKKRRQKIIDMQNSLWE
ncbi:MAG: DUF3006 domain-containing protein [Clostridiales bacterium]|nr:DUF3006 domain-containing protein [Clostridiales bacterium]